MIPVDFHYHAPASLDEALDLLTHAGDEGQVLAGGQSLIPVLKLRMAAPETLIDLGRVPELTGVTDDGDAITIGAMTSHDVIAYDPLVREHAALIAEATATVADPQVRHRGTFGGALVHADPAGDLGAPALAMDAEMEIAGTGGVRRVSATEFFTDLFSTAVGENEILTRVRVPKYTGWRAAYEKFVRVAQQWSIVAVGVALQVDNDTITRARVGLTNMGSTPLRARQVEDALAGCRVDASDVSEAVASVADGTDPPADLNGDAEYRRHLAAVLAERAVLAAGAERVAR